LETKERKGSKREGMSAGWPGGTKSKRLHTIAGLEENKMVGKASWVTNVAVPMQGSKAVAVRQEMEVGGVLGMMSVSMLMTMLVTVLVTILVTVSVVMMQVKVLVMMSVTVSATVSATGLVTVSVGVSRAVVEVLGPAAAMLVPAVELGPLWVLESAGGRARTRSAGTLHWVGGEHGWGICGRALCTALVIRGDSAAEVAGDQQSIPTREGIDISHHAGWPVHDMETAAN
jgi:hypothetical protein